MKTFSILLPVIILAGVGLHSSTTAQEEEARSDYEAYAQILSRYVDDQGMVKYARLKSDRSKLDDFLDSTARIPGEAYEKWSPDEKIAFWINVYNARTLEVIIDNYPTASQRGSKSRAPGIRQIPGAWDKISFTAAGRRLTLDEVEHKILRAEFNEPRIHMALVCAAHSCPPLRKEPYRGNKLNKQLEDQSRRFLSSRTNFSIDRNKGIIYLSAIFKWFGGDFKSAYKVKEAFGGYNATEGALLSFVSPHLDMKTQEVLTSRKWKIKYRDYDWHLNDRSSKDN